MLDGPVRLGELAEAVSLSPSRLSRLFADDWGCPSPRICGGPGCVGPSRDCARAATSLMPRTPAASPTAPTSTGCATRCSGWRRPRSRPISCAGSNSADLYKPGRRSAGEDCRHEFPRLLPYEPAWNHPLDDLGRDTAHTVVNETAILLSVAVIPTLAAVSPFHRFWPADLPFVVAVAESVLAADLGITMVHRASHKIDWMWRFHAVHHSVKRCYGLNGLMKHPLHLALEMAGGVLPLVLLGPPARPLLLRPGAPLQHRRPGHGRQTRLPESLPRTGRRVVPPVTVSQAARRRRAARWQPAARTPGTAQGRAGSQWQSRRSRCPGRHERARSGCWWTERASGPARP